MIWHSSDINSVVNELESNSENGLANGVVDLRLKKYGKNAIKNIEKPSYKKHFLSELNNKFVYALSIIAILSFIISIVYEKTDIFSPLLIILIVVINALISAYHLYRSELALNALKSIAHPTALVIRDGIKKQIPSEDLVPGDIILLKEGDYITADARIIEANNFACNEYVLSGEDIPVNKKAEDILDDITPVTKRTNMVYSGCAVSYGTAKAVVVETGLFTTLGQSSAIGQQIGKETMPFKEKLDSTAKLSNIIILIICAVVFLIGVIQNFNTLGFAATTITSLLNAMALAVAAIPEGLPAISTVAVALGIERMIKDEIIIKKVSALETLGKTTVICADKTGIITHNSMQLAKIFDGDAVFELDNTPINEKNNMILRLATACSTLEDDPTEAAVKSACTSYCGLDETEIGNLYPRVGFVPFDFSKKATISINVINGTPVAIVKGAPEMLVEYLTEANPENILKINDEFAKEAYRVVLVAMKPLDEIPANPSFSLVESGLNFVGLLGIDDQPRTDTIAAIKSCENAGIRTIMITGDNPLTAGAIARRVGILKDDTKVITGAELAEMSDEELYNNISKYSVFARICPEDKIRIIDALKKSGETVTVTGDGFKDIQALAAADIGCNMGENGSDVARGNADIIIRNSYFCSIVSAIKESRGLFANIQKTVAFLLSCNVAEILVYLLGLIIFKKPPLSAVQLLWINLLTDCAPVIALSTEKAEDNVMSERSHSLSGRLFDNKTLIDISLEALFMTAMSLVAFTVGYSIGQISVAMTMVFAVLAMSQIFHAFNIRTYKSIISTRLSLDSFMTVSSILILFIVLFLILTPAGYLFGLTVLNAKAFFISLLLAIAIIPFCEILKVIKKATK